MLRRGFSENQVRDTICDTTSYVHMLALDCAALVPKREPLCVQYSTVAHLEELIHQDDRG